VSARALACVLAALAASGGSCDPPPPAKPNPQCTDVKPCAQGLVCQNGACVACRLDNQCAAEQFCHPIRRRCEPRPCHGTECARHDDCPLGRFCVQGLCLQPDTTTPEGCSVESCADGETCPQGKRCEPQRLVCEEYYGCQSDVDCGSDQRCNVAAGRCEAACTPETAPTVCGVKRYCLDGTCVDCTADADCGSGLYCNVARHTCESKTTCSSNRDCEVPLLCNRLTRQCTVDPGPCLSSEDCAPDEDCQLSTGRCMPASCVPDRFEPDDTVATAHAVVPGAVPNLTLCGGDVDHLKLALARGDRVQALVDVDPLLNFDISLLTGTGDVVAQGSYAVDGTVALAGDYYVRTSSRDAYVRYGLRITVSRGIPCDPDANEPNDDAMHATPTPPGDQFGTSLCPGDADWYQVAVTRGKRVVAQLDSAPADGQIDIVLLDGDGARVLDRNAASAETETVSSTAFTGTRVYLKVSGATDWVQSSYDLHVYLRDP